MGQLTEELISDFMTFSHLGRDDSILMLEYNDNDPEKAVNKYFDNPSILGTYRSHKQVNPRWNEELFTADRDGNIVPTFDVQGPDVGPTRPNSRIANSSPNNGVIDLSDDAAAGALWEDFYDPKGKANPPYVADPNKSWGVEQNHEADMQQALRNSLRDAGIGLQESGTVPSNTHLAPEGSILQPSVEFGDNGQRPQFGPANRNTDYDNNEWAMVPLGTGTAHEIYLDPDPSYRQRKDGAPAFLRPSPDDSGLGWLLTIFHEIPVTREQFLRNGHSCSDYGHDSEWWSGKKIETPKLIVATDGEGEIEGFSQNHDMVEELQRLTAFLSKTTRSYGSADAITYILSHKRSEWGAVSDFFIEWALLMDETTYNRLFSIGVQPHMNGEDANDRKFMFLDIMEVGETLYDSLDSLLWTPSGLELENSAFLSHVGEVLVFRLYAKKQHDEMNIPLIWFPDRYLKSNREAALQMRKQKQTIVQQISEMDGVKQKLTNYTHDGKSIKVIDLINASLQHDVQPPIEAVINTELDSKMNDSYSEEQQAALAYISDQLRRTILSIDKKLDSLEKEKKRAQESLEELSKFYTEGKPGMHPYSLRGICVSSTLAYVKKIEYPDSDIEMSDSNLCRGIWWKLSFVAGEQYPIQTYKVTQNEVEVAAQNSIQPILVYASEQAMQPTLSHISEALLQFVEKDNAAFLAELPKSWSDIDEEEIPLTGLEEENFTREIEMTTPASPSKRKFDGGEEQDTWRESPGRRGSMDVNIEEGEMEEIRWDGQTPPLKRNSSRHFSSEDDGVEDQPQEMVQRGGLSLQQIAASAVTAVKDPGDMTMEDEEDNVMLDAEAVEESAAVKELGAPSSS